MSFAGKLTVKVFSLTGGPEYTGIFGQDKMDPYIRITLHDGEYDVGTQHRGETFVTSTKDNAGGSATYNEQYVVNKPENMDVARIQLFDSDVLVDDCHGSVDVDLDKVFERKIGVEVQKTVDLVSKGKKVATVNLAFRLDA